MPADREGPLHWPALQPEDSRQEWAALRTWVEQLVERFGWSARVIPPCWYRHNPLVETLSALRDYERACFHPRASPAAAYDFLRTLRDAEQLLTDWTSRAGCTAGDHHDRPTRTLMAEDDTGWAAVVEADYARRVALAAEVDEVLDYH